MKRFIIVFSILALFAGILSCDSSSDPAPVTKLTATVTYTASGGKAPAPDGTNKIYLYLYKNAPADGKVTPDYETSTSTAIASGTEYTLSISDIDAGDYYAMVFVDEYDMDADGTVEPDTSEGYEFYAGAANPASSEQVTVTSGSTTTISINFDDRRLLSTAAAFQTATTGTVTVQTRYTGTLTTATGNDNIGKIHVYLYKTWPPVSGDPAVENAQVIPDYSAKSDTTVADAATQYTINVSGVLPGNYYVVIFYDFKNHTNNLAGNTDRYILYNADDTTYYTGNITSEADAVTVDAGLTETLTLDFYDESIQFGSGGAFQSVLNEE